MGGSEAYLRFRSWPFFKQSLTIVRKDMCFLGDLRTLRVCIRLFVSFVTDD